jgi:hypothetical protein
VPTIDPANPVTTLITVHECQPEDQQALVDLLSEAASSIYANAPGFVSATIHRSIDGTRVTNYAQYESREAFERLRTNRLSPLSWSGFERSSHAPSRISTKLSAP